MAEKNKSYDENLYFELPAGLYTLEEKNENGDRVFKVTGGEKSIDDEGNESYEHFLFINKIDEESSLFADGDSADIFSLKGDIENRLRVLKNKISVLSFEITARTLFFAIRDGEDIYSIGATKAFKSASTEEDIKDWLAFVDKVAAAVRLNGKKCNFEPFTLDILMKNEIDPDEEEIKNAGFPIGTPGENQHSQLDFINNSKGMLGFLGGLISVNASGTEFSLESLEQIFDTYDSSDEELQIYRSIVAETEKSEFPLAKEALRMSELFRVDIDVFDSGHDREQEIQNGYVQRILTVNTFRSFAWTLAAYCDEKRIKPADVDIDTLFSLSDFIEKRGSLNYAADSFSPVICSGDDIHYYCIPDSVSGKIRQAMIKKVSDEDSREIEIKSLDGLRKELEYMAPAIRTIYNYLESTRDEYKPLEGGVADVLYVWCAFTCAAENAFYAEDGPVNCGWLHPDDSTGGDFVDFMLEEEVRLAEEWLETYKKYISENHKISFSGKTFVFSGCDSLDEWPDIRKKLEDKGGIVRTAISGKTDYLICCPEHAGESKINKVISDTAKKNKITIVLIDALAAQLGVDYLSAEARLSEHNEKKLEVRAKSKKKKADLTSSDYKGSLTYNEKLSVTAKDFRMDIPDGFVIKENAEGRDFIAYIPSADDPDDYMQSDMVIYAGVLQENKSFSQLRIPLEFSAIGAGVFSLVAQTLFQSDSFIKYLRRDLPGSICFAYEMDALHGNAIFGVDDHCRMMRVFMNNVPQSRVEEKKRDVLEIFNHMYALKPVTLLEEISEKKFVDMSLDSKTADEWIDLVNDYINHIAIARNLEQDNITKAFEVKQENGNASVPDLKKELKKMLRDISEYAESQLKKAEYIYLLKKAQYPGHKKLNNVQDVINALIECSCQFVNLNDERIESDSAFAHAAKKFNKQAVPDAIKAFEEAVSETEKQEMVPSLDAALSGFDERQKAYEEQKKLEDEKKKAEEQRKKEEEAKRLEAEKQRKAEEKRRKEEAKKEKTYNDAERMLAEGTIEKAEAAKQKFASLGKWKDAAARIADCDNRIAQLKQAEIERKNDEVYNSACAVFAKQSVILEYQNAIKTFETIPYWRDSQQKIELCRSKIAEIEEGIRLKKELKKKKCKRALIITAAVIVFLVLAVIGLRIHAISSSYNEAEALAAEGKNVEAAFAYGFAGSFKDAREKSFALWDEFASRKTIACGGKQNKNKVLFGAISENGDALYFGKEHPGYLPSDCVAVDANENSVWYLLADGTVSGWRGARGIVDIAVNDEFVFGLRADGKIVYKPIAEYSDINNGIDLIDDVVDIAAFDDYLVAVLADGTVMYADAQLNVYTDLKDITMAAAGEQLIVFLDSNGSVSCDTKYYTSFIEYVDEWENIVDISVRDDIAIGLKNDGTVALESNVLSADAVLRVLQWKDIVEVAAGLGYVLGVDKQGVLYTEGVPENAEPSDDVRILLGKMQHKVIEAVDTKKNADYNEAIALMNKGEYENAIAAFDKLDGYNDSLSQITACSEALAGRFYAEGDKISAVTWYEKAGNTSAANNARYEYVKANMNDTDLTTYEYLKVLKDADYEDAVSIFEGLYSAWSLTMVVNNSKDDTTQNMTTIPQSKGDPYVHYRITGGYPDQEIKLRFVHETRLKLGTLREWETENKSFASGKKTLTAAEGWQYISVYPTGSNLVYHRFTVYNEETGEVLATTTVSTPYDR